MMQISVASFVYELFRAAFDHLRTLVDNRDQTEINLIFGLMQELIHILEIDSEDLDLRLEHEANLGSLVTDLGYLVKYFR